MKDETPVEPIVSAELLKTQMDDLVENYNKLAEMMNLPKEETFAQKDPNQVNQKVGVSVAQKFEKCIMDMTKKMCHSTSFSFQDDDDQVNEDDKTPAKDNNDNNDDNDDDDDDNGDFENFVDNDGGEEEYLAKLRKEQEQRTQQQQQQEKDEPREESSRKYTIRIAYDKTFTLKCYRITMEKMRPHSFTHFTSPSPSRESATYSLFLSEESDLSELFRYVQNFQIF